MSEPKANHPEQLVRSIARVWADIVGESGTMPSEPELAARFKASRPAVREALVRLEERGYLHRSQGARTLANRDLPGAGTRVDEQRDHLVAIAQAGLEPQVDLLSSEFSQATEAEAKDHGVPSGSPVLRTSKVWSASGRRFAMAHDVVPINPSLADPQAVDPMDPVFDLAAELNGALVVWETVRLGAVVLDPSEADVLGCDGGPALELHYQGTNAVGDIAYWSREVQVNVPDGLQSVLVRHVRR